MRRTLTVAAALIAPLMMIAVITLGQPPREETDAAPLWERFATLGIRQSMVDADARWREFLDAPTMSAGLYRLPAGSEDRQRPHRRDELYYVIDGQASFRVDGEATDVAPGTVLYVAAGVEHRFEDITEELEVLVFFSKAEPNQ